MKLFISIILFFSVTVCQANVDMSTFSSYKKIHIIHLHDGGFYGFEINKKLGILLEALSKFDNRNNIDIYVYFYQNLSKQDSNYYTLGYGDNSFFFQYQKTATNGLKIFIKDRDVDIKKIFALVKAGAYNLDFIKENQKTEFFKTASVDTITTLPQQKVKQLMLGNMNAIYQLNNLNFYRNKEKELDDKKPNYSYDAWNGYTFSKEVWFKESYDTTLSMNYKKDYLRVDNVFEIVKTKEGETLVFINDSSFFYKSNFDDKNIQGPFTIKGLKDYRNSINEIWNENKPFNKIYFYVFEANRCSKVLFIPDSNLVINNYDSIESNFINLYKQNLVKPIAKHIRKNSNGFYILLAMCFATIGVYIVLRKK